MRTWQRIILSVWALLLIVGIIAATMLSIRKDEIKDYSAYCMDKVRDQLWEYIWDIVNNYNWIIEDEYQYSWKVSYEWIDYTFTCSVKDKDNIQLNLQSNEPEENVQSAKYDYLVLVNKQHKLPEDWESNVQLVEVQNAYDETIKVEKEALEKYNELRDALLQEGVDIELDSVYRPVSKQEEIWKEFEEKYGIDYTKKYVAIPWFSEHHTALAIDICLKKDWVLIYENEDMVKEKEIFDKVHEKLADYGFILRYLEWKEDITWYWYEPWHLRYIGNVDIAKEIMEKGITLEEYLDEVEEFISYYDDWSIREKWLYVGWAKQWTWTTYDEEWNIINEEKYVNWILSTDEDE